MYKIIGADQKEYGPVTADQVRQWIAEGRADARTLVQAEGGAWKPLSTFVEFADVLRAQPSATPPAASGQVPPPPLGASPSPGLMPGSTDARQAVQGPAICLIIVGALGGVLQAINLVMHLLGWAVGSMESTGNPQIDHILEMFSGGLGVVFILIPLAMSLLIIFGGVRMMSLRSFGFCIGATVIAMLPCVSPCCCLGLPIGIWALVVLNRPEVRAAFDAVAR